MTYWWNMNYTTTLVDGSKAHSEWYETHDLKSRARGSSVYWDTEHACRNTEAIEDWVKKNPAVPPGTVAECDLPGPGLC